jgi:hypothetical protein
MLACRLAGLSALEAQYGGPVVLPQSGRWEHDKESHRATRLMRESAANDQELRSHPRAIVQSSSQLPIARHRWATT